MTHRVAVLALPPVIGYDLVIPPLVFGEANEPGRPPRYEVSVVGLEPGELRTTRTRTFPWAEARAAHEAIGTGHTTGKLVLRVGEAPSSPRPGAPMGRT